MRDTKFMACDVEMGAIFTVLSLSFDENGVLVGAYLKCTEMGQAKYRLIKDIIILQYTGRKDKNDEEIYEGNIVERRWLKPYVPESVKEKILRSLVIFNDEESRFSFHTKLESGGSFETYGLNDGHNMYHEIYEIEIIGSIHGNLGLLK